VNPPYEFKSGEGSSESLTTILRGNWHLTIDILLEDVNNGIQTKISPKNHGKVYSRIVRSTGKRANAPPNIQTHILRMKEVGPIDEPNFTYIPGELSIHNQRNLGK